MIPTGIQCAHYKIYCEIFSVTNVYLSSTLLRNLKIIWKNTCWELRLYWLARRHCINCSVNFKESRQRMHKPADCTGLTATSRQVTDLNSFREKYLTLQCESTTVAIPSDSHSGRLAELKSLFWTLGVSVRLSWGDCVGWMISQKNCLLPPVTFIKETNVPRVAVTAVHCKNRIKQTCDSATKTK